MLGSLETVLPKHNKPIRAGLTQEEQRLLCVVMVKKGTSELAPTLAPGETQTSTLEPLQAQVARFGGLLSPLVDGSLLVVLMGDKAATDLAIRAARCALSLRALEPHAPIAVALGRAEVAHHLPVGALIDRTVRLLQAPMQDNIRIDSGCAGLLGERFLLHADEHGLLLSQERTRGASRTLLGRQSPCVGRERELSLLESAYQHCVEEPCARVTLVLANAGVGKSRLCEEFIGHIKHQDPETNTLLLVGQGDPMRAGASFGLLAPAIRACAHIYEDEAPDSAQHKLRERVLQSVTPEDAPRISEFLGELIGVPFPEAQSHLLTAARQDAQLMGDQMQLAFEDWLSAEARLHPVVFILEDLHWGDASTTKFIDAALRQLREQPFFVLALARPEVRSQFPTLWSTHGVEELRLPELSKKASARLIQSALGDKADAAISAALVERSAGNAFYLEELIRAVHQGKTEQFPETVLAMAQARLEGLSAELRRVLRAASIFGQTCWSGAVMALIEDTEVKELLRELAEQELMVRSSKSKFAGEEEHSFRHALLREAAYASLTDEDKKLGHKLAAEWLERSQEKEPLLLAEHFERGGEPLQAAPYYLNAARQALEGNDLQQTIHLAQRGIGCGVGGEILSSLLLIKAEAHNWRTEFREAEPLALQAMQAFTPQSHEWFHAIAEAILASGRRGNNSLLISLSKELHDVPWGELPDLFQLIAYNRAIPRLAINGHFPLAFSLSERLRTLPESFSEPTRDAWLKMSVASVHFTIGHDPGITIRIIEESIEAFKRLGDLRNAALEMTSLTFIEQFVGVWEEERTREAITIAERIQLPRVEMTAKLYLARFLQMKQRITEWKTLTQSMLEAACARADHQIEGLTRASRAECAMVEDNLEAAEQELLITNDRLRPFGMMRGHALWLLSKVYLKQQRTKEALDAIQEARVFLPPEHLFGAATNAESGLRLIYAQALLANDRHEEGLLELRKARDRLESRAEKISDPTLRQSFLTNIPENRETLQLAASLLT